jgi:uncharacterized protein YdaU (DUF1376 family)
MHYYKRDLGRYYKKTAKLSMLEHGAYTLLLDAYYDRERQPTRDEAIAWCWADSDEEIAALDKILKRFFVKHGDVYHNSFADEVIDAYQENSNNNKKIAQEREQKRRKEKARTVHEPRTNREPTVHEPPPNHKLLTTNQELLITNQESVTKNKKSKNKELNHLQVASDTARQDKCRVIWSNYKNAYYNRYGTEPVRNAKTNKQVVALLDRLGDEAQHVANYYLSINDSFLIKRAHDFGSLLSGCEGYRTQWATNKTITTTQAQQVDREQSNINAVQEAVGRMFSE